MRFTTSIVLITVSPALSLSEQFVKFLVQTQIKLNLKYTVKYIYKQHFLRIYVYLIHSYEIRKCLNFCVFS